MSALDMAQSSEKQPQKRGPVLATVTQTDKPMLLLQLNLAEHQAAFNKMPGQGNHRALPLQMLIPLCCFISSKHLITLPVISLLRLDAGGLIDFPATQSKSY